MRAGDILTIGVRAEGGASIGANLWTGVADATGPEKLELKTLGAAPVERTVRLLLTDQPVVPPPPGLYAALTRRESADRKRVQLSLPLYAQSPLPWRVDLVDARADFRAGRMRRSATFVWTLTRPLAELEGQRIGVHVVKAERSGQTYLPDPTTVGEAAAIAQFVAPRRVDVET